jgi:Holliday junction resolvase
MVARKAQNTNRQGANFELQIMHDLDRYGYTTMRSSGSRGAVDVVAVGDHETLWVQAKITDPMISPKERRAVVDLAVRAKGTPVVAHRDNGVVLYRVLTDIGPKDWSPLTPIYSKRAVCATCKHPARMHTQDTGCWSETSSIPGSDFMCDCPAFRLMTTAQWAEWKRENKA